MTVLKNKFYVISIEMGKTNSKIEQKEVIIAQNGGQGNSAVESQPEIAYYMERNNILIAIVLGVFGFIILLFLVKKFKEWHHNWMKTEIQSEFVRRMQMRLSGRRTASGDNNEEFQA